MTRTFTLALAICCGANMAQAVIVGPGDGTQNTSGTGMSSGWNYVGTVDGASGVYIGNGWVLTADHVGGITAGTTTFTLSGTVYTANTGATRILNSDNSVADLQLFHLATAPALPFLSLSSSTPTAGTEIYMVGYGCSPRNTTVTYYTVSGSVWTVDATSTGASVGAFGYTYQPGTKRWGTNTIDAGGDTITNAGYGNTSVMKASFYGTNNVNGLLNYLNSTPGTPSEALVAPGDSGGGVFDSTGRLLGINNYVGTFTGQPSNTAAFGNVSEMADISVYRSQIMAVVPEPSAVTMAAGFVLAALRARRRNG